MGQTYIVWHFILNQLAWCHCRPCTDCLRIMCCIINIVLYCMSAACSHNAVQALNEIMFTNLSLLQSTLSTSANLTDSTCTVITLLEVKHFLLWFISDVFAESLLQWLISYWGHWVVLNRASTICGCQCALGRGCCKRPLSIWGCRKPACRQKKLIHPAPWATLQALLHPKLSIFVTATSILQSL